MAQEKTPKLKWPSDPSEYEWKGTLLDNKQSNCIVLAYCKFIKCDVIIDIKQFDDHVELHDISAFSQRLRSLISLKHAHIFSPIHSFEWKNQIWIVYDRHSGGNLMELLASHYPNGIKDVNLIACLLRDAIEGLSYLHKQQVCHRNICPAAIFFDKESKSALLSEFGELKSIKFTKQHDRSKSVIAHDREPWTDPLILIKHPKMSWYAGDVYALGLTALHLTNGVPPIYDAKIRQRMSKILTHPNSSEQDDDKLYEQFGLEEYVLREIECKEFQQFINDCTAPIGKRKNVIDLLQHSFFKRYGYEKEEIGQLLAGIIPTLEVKIDGNLDAPLMFPNGRKSKDIIKKSSGDQELKVDDDDGSDNAGAKSSEKKEAVETKEDDNESFVFTTDLSTASVVPLKKEQVRKLVKDEMKRVNGTKEEIEVKNVTFEEKPKWNEMGVSEWTVEDCANWIDSLGDAYGQYKAAIIENGIDGAMMKELDEETLEEIITSKLHRKKVISSFEKLMN